MYANNISQALAECTSYLAAWAMYNKMGMRRGLFTGFVVSLFGMVALLIYEGDDQVLLSLFIVFSKFGVSAAFCLCWFGSQSVFPAEAVVFGLGTCAAIGHMASILSPMAAWARWPWLPSATESKRWSL